MTPSMVAARVVRERIGACSRDYRCHRGAGRLPSSWCGANVGSRGGPRNSSNGILQDKSDFQFHAVLGDFAVLDVNLLILNPGALDVFQGLVGTGDANL